MRFAKIVSAALLALLPAACGGSQDEAQDASQAQNQYGGQYQGQPGQYQQPGQYPQQPGAYPQQPGAYPQQQPGAYPQQQPGAYPQQQPAPTQPQMPGAQPAAGGGSATAVAPAMAAAATPALTLLAGQEVQGMQPEGGAFAAQFQTGQTFEQAFNMQGGKCYSVIAVGVPPVSQVDLQIVVQQPPFPAVVLAQSNTAGANATLGGKGQCFRNSLPLGGPAKVIMKVSGGQGIAVGQIYVK